MEKVNDGWARIICIPLLGFMAPIAFKTYTNPYWTNEFYLNSLISIFLTAILWQGNRTVILILRSRFPGMHNTPERVVYQTIISSAFTVLVVILIHQIITRCFDITLCAGEDVVTNIKIGLFCTFFITAIYESVYFFGKWKEAIIEGEELKRSNIQSQYETLKNQVNPHFLFNSFNTLSSIIDEDPKTAVQFVQQLSGVYRYVLQSRDKDLVDIESELNFIKSYLFLNQIRFGTNLKVNISVPETAFNNKVPPLVLQLLVENAIKHNIISAEKPLLIEIHLDENHNLAVKNNLQKKSSIEPSSGIGLQNIISRFSFFTDKKVTISIEDKQCFLVLLPLLNTPKQ